MSAPLGGPEEVRALWSYIRWLVTGIATLLVILCGGVLAWFLRLERRIMHGLTYERHEKICGPRWAEVKKLLDEKASKQEIHDLRSSLDDWRSERRARDVQQDAMHAENRAALQAILLRLPEQRRAR